MYITIVYFALHSSSHIDDLSCLSSHRSRYDIQHVYVSYKNYNSNYLILGDIMYVVMENKKCLFLAFNLIRTKITSFPNIEIRFVFHFDDIRLSVDIALSLKKRNKIYIEDKGKKCHFPLGSLMNQLNYTFYVNYIYVIKEKISKYLLTIDLAYD